VFRMFDADFSGSLDHGEFRRGLHHLGVAVSEKDFDKLLDLVDMDRGGDINYNEFATMLKRPDYAGKQAEGIPAHMNEAAKHAKAAKGHEHDRVNTDLMPDNGTERHVEEGRNSGQYGAQMSREDFDPVGPQGELLHHQVHRNLPPLQAPPAVAAALGEIVTTRSQGSQRSGGGGSGGGGSRRGSVPSRRGSQGSVRSADIRNSRPGSRNAYNSTLGGGGSQPGSQNGGSRRGSFGSVHSGGGGSRRGSNASLKQQHAEAAYDADMQAVRDLPM